MLAADDAVLCTGTIQNADFLTKAKAAAEAGFRGISLRPAEYLAALDGGLSPADFKAVLSSYGLAVAELDPVLDWLPSPVPANRNPLPVDDIIAIARVVEPHCLSVLVDTSYRGGLDALIAPFRRLCDRAAGEGLVCALEFFAFSPLRTLAATWRLIGEADRPNGAMIFDNWHHARVGGTDADLALVDAARIVGIQLSDTAAAPEHRSLGRECMAERRWPGEGTSAPRRTLAHLRARGCGAPVGIEVFGAGDPGERARAAGRALDDLRRAAAPG